MSNRYSNSLILTITTVATGCTGLSFGVRDRAEDAFRRQNRLSSELMLSAAEMNNITPATYEALLEKEGIMLHACQPLNALAAKRRDQTPVSRDDKKAIPGSLAACERASDELERSLHDALQRTSDKNNELPDSQ